MVLPVLHATARSTIAVNVLQQLNVTHVKVPSLPLTLLAKLVDNCSVIAFNVISMLARHASPIMS